MTSLSVIKLAVELNKAFGFEAQVKKMMKGCSVLSIEDELQEFMFSGTANLQTVKKKKRKNIRLSTHFQKLSSACILTV